MNLIKKKEEGEWVTDQVVLGFSIDTVACAISLPPVRIEGDRTLFMSDEFRPGDMRIRLRTLQEIRGLAKNWLAAGLFWRALCQVVDCLLSYATEDCAYVACENVELWHSMWNMMAFIRVLAETPFVWEKLFVSPLDRLLNMEQRFSGRKIECDLARATGDATLQ